MLAETKKWFNAAIGFFYPEICQYCRQERATPDEGFICAECRKNLKWIEAPFCDRCGLPFSGDISTVFVCSNCNDLTLHFRKARSAVLFEEIIVEVIHRYKYNQALWFERFLANCLVERAAPELRKEPWDVIVPVPLHPRKEKEREFNQAERLARQLSRASGIPMSKRILRRVEPTRTQTRLTRKERLENVRKAFALFPGTHLNGQRIVLIDDVFTTGATSSSCAKVLRDAGAADVCVWTVARGGLN
jgi:competence protein ComFC